MNIHKNNKQNPILFTCVCLSYLNIRFKIERLSKEINTNHQKNHCFLNHCIIKKKRSRFKKNTKYNKKNIYESN